MGEGESGGGWHGGGKGCKNVTTCVGVRVWCLLVVVASRGGGAATYGDGLRLRGNHWLWGAMSGKTQKEGKTYMQTYHNCPDNPVPGNPLTRVQTRSTCKAKGNRAVSSHGGARHGARIPARIRWSCTNSIDLQTGIRRAFKPGGVSVVVVIVVVVVIIVIIFVWIIRSRASADQRRDTDLCRNATAAFTPGWPAHL